MNQQEILDYNKRCALFLGKEYKHNKIVSPFTHFSGQNPTGKIWEECRFHSDWNWIMEVVEAIQKIIIKNDDEFCIEFYEGLPDKPKTFVSITENIQSENNNPKEAVVEAINQFLIWHEQNKQL
jgi:hypothetical protein